ncbi:Nucleoside-diphosphate-sugar epimerase [Rathayibacter oskolensis]|uniref:Nucleoside-diphosphate-sugar epimerase n=1 Tax=Rathayibacter oskolensis TaxID=1891671 RepID=A0A1X7NK46_9MICO|nr:NmrA family NAD(P)-binding protein [Rathayibacter oskolensis]SMH38238.1 Nucleoside-diphosphate-sugar epimerase [Rathayibacter oskolensis]
MATVVVAGGRGDLGARIVDRLRDRDATVRVLTRSGGGGSTSTRDDVEFVEADYSDQEALRRAVTGADVVVSALSGARPVIIDAQRALLDAAVAAGVPRFIPSDYSADYRSIRPGTNRNLELRREFASALDAAPLRSTSVFNGAFTDLLTGQAPLILPRLRRVLFWSHPDQVLDFTTKDDTARVAALVALDPEAPRAVEVAGDRVTARGLARTMSELTGDSYRLQWAGTVGGLSQLTRVLRASSRDTTSAFPAWQGMQYVVTMFSGEGQLHHIDNDRYGPIAWTTARDVMALHLARASDRS